MPLESSRFDLTHERTLSMDMGKLVPILLEEILPGDEFSVKTDMLVRMAPMLAPMMHRVNVYTHYFFVPSRILWTEWENFITGGADGADASVHPTIAAPSSGGGFALNTLADFLGAPTGINSFVVQAMPFRAYDEIFNQWYRDQNLVSPVTVSKAGGPDTTTNTALLSRAWEKDRFTNALPWAQRGAPVSVPLGGTVPVTRVSNAPGTVLYNAGANTQPGSEDLWVDTTTKQISDQSLTKHFSIDPNGGLEANLGSANPITINALRQVILLQKWMEKNARGGARYVESILEHFKVRSSDARLQRPEYLGGGVSPLTVSEVLQTSATGASGTPLGAMAGHGYSVPGIHAFKKSFEEHGYVIGILSVLPRTKYQQGSMPIWNRRSRFDYAWPTFAGLGEQPILKKEIYAASADPDGVFGYAPRYQEYRERESTVHGDFKSTLNYWTMARIFGSEPTLNSAFVQSDPTKWILAATDEPAMWVQVLNNVQAKRPLPLVGIPGTSGI